MTMVLLHVFHVFDSKTAPKRSNVVKKEVKATQTSSRPSSKYIRTLKILSGYFQETPICCTLSYVETSILTVFLNQTSVLQMKMGFFVLHTFAHFWSILPENCICFALYCFVLPIFVLKVLMHHKISTKTVKTPRKKPKNDQKWPKRPHNKVKTTPKTTLK